VFQPALWSQIPGLSGLKHPVRAYLVLDLALAIAAGIGVGRLGRARSLRAPFVVVGVALCGYATVVTLFAVAPQVFNLPLNADPADLTRVRDMASDALTRPWPLLFELTAAGLALALLRRAGSTAVRRAAAMVVVAAPLVVLLPGVNQALPASTFSMDGTALVQSVRNASPHRALSVQVPFYAGFPDQSQRGFADLYNQSSLELATSFDMWSALQGNPGSSVAPAIGIDTEVVFGRACVVGREVAFVASYAAHVCHLDNALKPPYWLPAQSVGPQLVRSSSVVNPVDVSLNPVQVLTDAVPATVRSWDSGRAVIAVDSSKEGYLFIDRAWWPGWQVSVDGRPVTPLRALGGQLIPLAAGRHVVEEHLFLVDVAAGAVITGTTLTLLILFMLIGRRRSKSLGN
jgi:hypothetical protein